MPIKMPARKPVADPDSFIAGATSGPPSPPVPRPAGPVPEALPWQDPRVRDDLRIQLNTKLPERLTLQLDWLAARLRLKKQDVIELALRAWVETELDKLGLES